MRTALIALSLASLLTFQTFHGSAHAEDPANPDGITAEEALAVPDDQDDADDIAEDNNPDDPGQEAVEHPVDEWPNPGVDDD